MPRPQRPWFRFYVEAVHDPKLCSLSYQHRWLWLSVLAAARQSPVPGVLLIAEDTPMSRADLARFAGMSGGQVDSGIVAFKKLGMVGHSEDGEAWCVVNWKERQYESDNTTERTRKHRSNEPRRNVPTAFPGTPPENREQNTEPTTPAVVTYEACGQPEAAADYDQVVEAIAQRQLEQATNVRSASGWLAKARLRIAVEQGVRITDLLVTHPVDTVVDMLEPPPKPKAAENPYAHFEDFTGLAER